MKANMTEARRCEISLLNDRKLEILVQVSTMLFSADVQCLFAWNCLGHAKMAFVVALTFLCMSPENSLGKQLLPKTEKTRVAPKE